MNDFEDAIDSEVYEAAVGLFGGNDSQAVNWLNTPCLALGSIKPVDANPQDVLAVIWRLNFGCLQ
jgi:uncharacterized protein (DUF2384 family)